MILATVGELVICNRNSFTIRCCMCTRAHVYSSAGAHDRRESAEATPVPGELGQDTAEGGPRARIVLLASEGVPNNASAARLGTSRPTVLLWRSRFQARGAPGLLKEAPRPGRKKALSPAVVKRVVEATLHSTPRGATHWSTRTLAKALGVSHMTVHRIWKQHGLKPHRVETFKLSRDPRFVEKLTDVVGLYLDPPEHALVLCADEKSQIQALDRTQPGLPMKKGRCGTLTHDYKRNGTTTLFAALDSLTGQLIGTCLPKHRHQEWLRFLRPDRAQTPPDLDLHLIVDNYATHKHPAVQRWLARHPASTCTSFRPAARG